MNLTESLTIKPICAWLLGLILLALADFAHCQTDGSTIRLQWTDNSSNERGFQIERSENGIDFHKIATVAANQSHYEDAEAALSSEYHYRVKAYNEFGSSGYSNVVIAKAEQPGAPASPETKLPVIDAIIGTTSNPGSLEWDSVNGVHTISASGLGYEMLHDQLRFVYTTRLGDFRYVIRIHHFDADDTAGRMGIMIRKNMDPSSPHCSITLNGDLKIESLVRKQAGSNVEIRSGSTAPTPTYLAIQRIGSDVRLEYSFDGLEWILQEASNWDHGDQVLVGVAIGSQRDGRLSAGIFEEIGQSAPSTDELNSPQLLTRTIIGDMLDEGEWTHDVGTSIQTLSSSGLGYEQFEDELAYLHGSLLADGRMEIRIDSFSADGTSARMGLMIRESLDQNAAHVSMTINGSGKFEALHRTRAGDRISVKTGPTATLPAYVAIERNGFLMLAQHSNDGKNWTTLTQIELPALATPLMGVQIGSHSDGRLSESTFDLRACVGLESNRPLPKDAKWFNTVSASETIGLPESEKGFHEYLPETDTHTMEVSGLGFESIMDQLRFQAIQVDGNSDMTIRIDSFTSSDDWSRAGLMARWGNQPDDPHFSLILNGKRNFESFARVGKGIAMGQRSEQAVQEAAYLRISKRGNTMKALVSSNGEQWTTLKEVTSANFGDPYSIGLVIGAQSAGRPCSTVITIQDFQLIEN